MTSFVHKTFWQIYPPYFIFLRKDLQYQDINYYADDIHFYKCHFPTRHPTKVNLTGSTCWFRYSRHEAHMKPQYSSLLFPLQISGRTAQSATNVGVETFARLFLPMTARLRRGRLFWFAPLPVHALTDSPGEGGWGVGWTGQRVSGCVCPRLDLREEGGGALRDAWERRQHLLSRGAALRHSSAEQRGEELCGRDGWPSVNWRNAHNNPLWLLEKYRQIPPSPSFLFLGDFLAFDIVQSRSLLQV